MSDKILIKNNNKQRQNIQYQNYHKIEKNYSRKFEIIKNLKNNDTLNFPKIIKDIQAFNLNERESSRVKKRHEEREVRLISGKKKIPSYPQNSLENVIFYINLRIISRLRIINYLIQC